jgi:predicted dehydrogenase
MDRLRVALVGVGYLGRFHAQKYAALAECELVALADPNVEAAGALARELGTRSVADYRQLLGQVDAVSVVTPTPLHFEVARTFLEAGVHVLVEKPITETVGQAGQLIAAARRAGRVLQVGHLERFNPAILAAEPHLHSPRFIECQRLAPFRERGTDVNVVLDLMIHDLDLVQSIVGSPIASIDAVGTPVFSPEIDIANARIRFANGCVVNATASRVSLKTERKLRIFRDDAYLSIDLQQKILTVIRKQPLSPGEARLPVSIDEQSFESGDALRSEIEAFLSSCRGERPVVVSGADGMRALETAITITAAVLAGAPPASPATSATAPATPI